MINIALIFTVFSYAGPDKYMYNFPFFPLELLGGSSLQEALWDYPMAIWPGSGFVQVILVALTLLTPGVIDKLQSTKCRIENVLKDLQKTKCLQPYDW